MKPGNVLLDRDGHVYLTDFGITQQLGGASTDTGRMVGTLDYLAPEQIRGDPVDARTDGYALGCVLYECLAGRPPFRRDTEAETMWAHMQEEPAPLRGLGRLDPVLRKALAKDREDRFASSAELDRGGGRRARATGAGCEPPPGRAGRCCGGVGERCWPAARCCSLRRSRWGSSRRPVATSAEELGNGLAAIDTGGEVTSFTESEAAPGNVAVGEGAVWVLDNERQTVSRIDPETKRITKTFKTRGVPSELAVGEGALWIGNAGAGDATNAMVSVSRVDPKSGRITRTVRLRGDDGRVPGCGRTPDRGRRGCGLGGESRWQRRSHRSRQRAARGHDRRQREARGPSRPERRESGSSATTPRSRRSTRGRTG